MIFQLLLAVTPGLAIAWFIYRIDKYEREKFLPLTIAFFTGALITLPVMEAQKWFFIMGWEHSASLLPALFVSFVLVSIPEETVKFLALLFSSAYKRHFNEPLDGIVYSVMISMGFATLENIYYALEFGMPTTALRALTAVPAHAVFAAMMGYYVGKATFQTPKKRLLRFKGWALAVTVHGIYDFFIIQEIYDALALLAIVTLTISLFFAFKLIREGQEASPFRKE
jgi:RsiW-degrading membrane proteinase PrsW (M82 family)